jgi:ferritin
MATLPTLVPEQFESKTLMDAIENAYANELDLLMYYRDLYNEEGKEYPEIAEHLMFYLKTQREAVGFYGDIIAMFTSEKNNPNINMIIDQKLGKLAK